MTLKDNIFSSLHLERDVQVRVQMRLVVRAPVLTLHRVAQFKVNLTNLLDCLNVFSHSLVKDNPLLISYGSDGILSLRSV